jgi:hypothetical protein
MSRSSATTDVEAKEMLADGASILGQSAVARARTMIKRLPSDKGGGGVWGSQIGLRSSLSNFMLLLLYHSPRLDCYGRCSAGCTAR